MTKNVGRRIMEKLCQNQGAGYVMGKTKSLEANDIRVCWKT